MNLFSRKSLVVTLVCFAAFASRLEAQWQARHGLTPAQYQSAFDDLSKQGYRLKTVSGYVSGGERYAALWVKEAGPAWTARHGLSAADYQKAFDDLAKQGYRLTWVTGYEVGGALKYAAIWEKKGGPELAARHGLSSGDYQKAFDDFTKQGFRLVHISGYNAGGSAHFAAIFEKSGGPAWQARHNMSAADYQKAFDDFAKQGYRLKEVSGYNVGGQDNYAAIWEKTGGLTWYSRNGIPDAWYQNVYDNFYYQGNQPVYISAFSSSGGAGKLNVIWDNPNFSGADLQAISQKIQAYMSANQVPGVALAITKDGRLVYAAGFGYANKETGEEAAPTNMWRIASVSKNITSTAIMKLVEKGSLHLTDNVFGPGSLLGAQFPTPAGNKKIEQIKVKHLLEHVSGLSNTNGDPMFMNTGMNHTQLISWMLNDPGHKMTRDANTQFEYLNFGYCLLGRIIEKVSGQSYDEFVKQNVLGPSGVTEMAIGANSEAQRKPREVKYYPGIAYSLNVTRFDSHGGWVASPIDLVRYVVRVDGLPTKPDIFTAASHTAVTTDSGIKDANGKDPNYGFGWGLPQWHNGDIDGSIAFLQVLPGGYTYSVLANTRPANDGGAFNLSGVVQKIISTTPKWPAYDLF